MKKITYLACFGVFWGGISLHAGPRSFKPAFILGAIGLSLEGLRALANSHIKNLDTIRLEERKRNPLLPPCIDTWGQDKVRLFARKGAWVSGGAGSVAIALGIAAARSRSRIRRKAKELEDAVCQQKLAVQQGKNAIVAAVNGYATPTNQQKSLLDAFGRYLIKNDHFWRAYAGNEASMSSPSFVNDTVDAFIAVELAGKFNAPIQKDMLMRLAGPDGQPVVGLVMKDAAAYAKACCAQEQLEQEMAKAKLAVANLPAI